MKSDNQRGAAFVEYVMLLTFVMVIVIVSVRFVGESTRDSIDNSNDKLAVMGP